LVLDSTISENVPMESNHQLNRNITLSDAPSPLRQDNLMGLILERSPSADFGDGTASLALEWIWNDQHSKDWELETGADLDDRMVQ
jgi:hypothetical protein